VNNLIKAKNYIPISIIVVFIMAVAQLALAADIETYTEDNREIYIQNESRQGEVVTIISQVTFSEIKNVSGVWLGGFADNESGNPTVLSVSWTSVPSGWFGDFWGIQVQSDRGLLPDRLSPKTGSNFLKDSSYSTLLTIDPKADHEYQTLLSYNPTTGDASLLVKDLTDNVEIVNQALVLNPYDGPLYAGVGKVVKQAADLSKVSLDSDFQVDKAFVPVGVNWLIYERENNSQEYYPATQLDRRKEHIMLVKLPWKGLLGNLEVWLENQDVEKKLDPVPIDSVEIIIPITGLPSYSAGQYTIRVEYVNGDFRWELGKKNVQIGVGKATFSQIETGYIDRWRSYIKGTVDVEVDGFVDELNLDVLAAQTIKTYDLEQAVTFDVELVQSFSSTDLSEGIHQYAFQGELALAEDGQIKTWDALLSLEFDTGLLIAGESAKVKLLDYPRQIFSIAIDDPQTTRAVSWRTDRKLDGMELHFSIDSNVPIDEWTVVKPDEINYRPSETTWIYTAHIEGLEPQTEYQAVIVYDYYQTPVFTFSTDSALSPYEEEGIRPPDIYFPLDKQHVDKNLHWWRTNLVKYEYYQEVGRKVQVVYVPFKDHYGLEATYYFNDGKMPSNVEEVYLRWKVYLPEKWSSGTPSVHMKMPGLGDPNGAGWKVRSAIRNRSDGTVGAEFYMYYPDKVISGFGSIYTWETSFNRGEWVEMQMYVKVNDPGEYNGILRAWVNKELCYERTDFRLREAGDGEFGVSEVMWLVYNGGAESSALDQHVVFRDIEVWIGSQTE
jgi:hypothetical protein